VRISFWVSRCIGQTCCGEDLLISPVSSHIILFSLILPLHCYGEAAELDPCSIISYSLAWSTTTGSVSGLYLILRPVFVLDEHPSEEFIITMEVCYDHDSNPGSHGCEPGAPPSNFPSRLFDSSPSQWVVRKLSYHPKHQMLSGYKLIPDREICAIFILLFYAQALVHTLWPILAKPEACHEAIGAGNKKESWRGLWERSIQGLKSRF